MRQRELAQRAERVGGDVGADEVEIVGMAFEKYGHVALGEITTLDAELAGQLEPRTSRPEGKLAAITALAAAGIPTGVMVAPVIPSLAITRQVADRISSRFECQSTIFGRAVNTSETLCLFFCRTSV